MKHDYKTRVSRMCNYLQNNAMNHEINANCKYKLQSYFTMTTLHF